MKRMKVIALAAAALLGLSGCQLVSFNEEKDRNQVCLLYTSRCV